MHINAAYAPPKFWKQRLRTVNIVYPPLTSVNTPKAHRFYADLNIEVDFGSWFEQGLSISATDTF